MRGIERQAGLGAAVAHERERAIDVLRGLRVEADPVRAGLRECADEGVDGRDHQVDVDRDA